jgi:integrase
MPRKARGEGEAPATKAAPAAKRIKLPHGQGTLFYLAGEGCWVGEVSLGRDPVTGRYRRERVRGADEAEVARRMEEIRRERDRGRRPDAGRMTVRDFLELWLERVVRPAARPGTYERYCRAVDHHIAPGLGHIRLAKLGPEDIQELLAALAERGRLPRHEKELEAREGRAPMPAGLSPRSVLFVRAVLRRALAQAVKWRYVVDNPATLVDPPPAAAYEAAFLDEAGARALLKAAAGDRLEGLVTIALCMGLRQGEALGLTWADVDLEAGVLRVRRQLQRVDGRPQLVELKTARSRRDLPVPDVVAAALRAQRARQAEERLQAGARWQDWGLVFATSSGAPWIPRNLTRDFKRLLAAAGLPDVRWHDLRHSAGSLLHARGVDLPTIMAILGHSQISVTANTYLHLGAAAKRGAAEAMDRAVAPAPAAAGRGGWRSAAARPPRRA